MTNARRSLITTGVIALIVLALLTVGGFAVRNYLSSAFFAAERVRDLRDLGFTAVREQLDEETGLRGYAATGDRTFLEPFDTSRPLLAASFAELHARIARRQPDALPLLLDAQTISGRWTATVATPILRDRHRNALLIQLHGKALMDRFRSDMTGIDVLLAAREARIAAQSRDGIDAAVAMNRSRQALISSALLDADPASVLHRVNDEMASQNSPLVTAIAGFADSQTFEFVFAIAGHPPPVLLEPGRAPRLLGFGSLPLGAIAGTTYRTDRVQTVPGAMLVLYTDGAVEHSHDVLAGEELLLRAVAGVAETASTEPATFIHQTIFAGRHVGDDVAILTVGFASDPATGRAGRSPAPAIQSPL